MKLVIGNYNYSSWSLRPWILMRRAGIDFDEVRIPLATQEGERMKAEWCPAGKVPVLYDGPLVLWDSLAICEYVADKVADAESGPTLWPRDVHRRAEARAMSAEMHSGFSTLRRTMPMNCRRVVRGFEPDFDTRVDIDRLVDLFEVALSRSGSRSGSGHGSPGESASAPADGSASAPADGSSGGSLPDRVGKADGPWLFGAYSVADAMFAPIASRFRTYGISVPRATHAWIEATLGDAPMREWYAAAEAEFEVIERSEVPDRDLPESGPSGG